MGAGAHKTKKRHSYGTFPRFHPDDIMQLTAQKSNSYSRQSSRGRGEKNHHTSREGSGGRGVKGEGGPTRKRYTHTWKNYSPLSGRGQTAPTNRRGPPGFELQGAQLLSQNMMAYRVLGGQHCHNRGVDNFKRAFSVRIRTTCKTREEERRDLGSDILDWG